MLCVCGSESAAEKVDRAFSAGDPGGRVHVAYVRSILDGIGELARNEYDVVLAEVDSFDSTGANSAGELRRCAPRLPLILLASAARRDAALAAVGGTAQEFFVIENLDSEALRKSVQRASETAERGRLAAGMERRSNARFPCRLAITWRTLEQPIISGEGTSETLNISSKGILFATSQQFEPGQLLQVSLDWPARLGNEVPLKLVVEGRVLRNSHGKAAMSIERYEFRTRKGAASPHATPPHATPPHATGGTGFQPVRT